MITGDIKSQIDRIWDSFWSGGISNPLEVIEQITYLLFIRRLDDLYTLEGQCLPVLANPPFAGSLDCKNTATVLSVKRQALLTELDALFASLQHRAFRGEL
jgi:hypothetical protein